MLLLRKFIIMKNNDLKAHLLPLLGSELAEFIAAAPEPPTIRLNRLNGRDTEEFLRRLIRYGRNFKKIPFTNSGFILDRDEKPISQTLDFYCGNFQYQGISSQLPTQVLNPQPGEKVLDMASAPGSKATQLADLMNNSGVLYLNDWSHKRLPALQTNTQRAGVMNQIILNLPGERLGNLFPEFFDKILLDAPCTGTGTMSDHPDVTQWWTAEKMHKLTLIQEQLLISAYKALKTGGELVYSTCSVCVEENEALIDRFLSNYHLEILEINLPGKESLSAGLTSFNPKTFQPRMSDALRIWPHRHGMEGFFIIRLRKLQAQNRIISRKPIFNGTLTCEDPTVSPILGNLTGYWSIPKEFWSNYRFILTTDRLWITGRDLEEYPVEGFNCAGLLFAERRGTRWKLFNQSIQLLGNKLGRRQVSLSIDQMHELFRQGFLEKSNLPNGYFALFWKDEAVGAVYVESGTLRIKLPHRFPEIELP